MPRLVALIIVLVSLLICTVATASEESKRLYSRGLVDFNAKRYAKALELFDRAVGADPEDAYALYYRGVTRARLNDDAGTVADLRAALAKRPSLTQAQLELGVALIRTNQYGEAIPWLERAQRVKSLEGRASLFLGIAQLRLDHTDAARKNFERAAELSPSLRLSARYYQGVVAYRQQQWAQADEQFSYVATTSPNSVMGREAATFLASLRGAQRPTYEVFGALGLQYDSNVVLAPSNNAIKNNLGVSKQADGRATIDAGGTYVPWRTAQAELAVGYEFYQTLHFELHDFNLQDHRPSAQLLFNAAPVQVGLQGRYDYYLLETDSFLQEATVLPFLTVAEGEFGSAEVFYQMRRQDFKQLAYQILDGFNHSTGIRQLFYLGSHDRYFSLGYRFDRQEPVTQQGDFFAYDGNEVNSSVGWIFPADVHADVTYAYRNEQYDPRSASSDPPGIRRRDDEQLFVVALRKQLNEHFGVTAAYYGDFNASNKVDFSYTRNIGSLSVDVRY